MRAINAETIMQPCNRCGFRLKPEDPRATLDGRIYCLYCHWKCEQEAVRTIAPLIDLGVQDEPKK